MSISVTEPMPDQPLLGEDEPAPVLCLNPQGKSNFVIAVDHASRMIPRSLGTLGLTDAALRSHIAWDIGSLMVAHRVATLLDAPLVAQNYSRLVIDCNRPPTSASSIPVAGESDDIPGNIGLTAQQIDSRRRAIFDPYHHQLRQLLDERAAQGRKTILVAQHSMTDSFKGVWRPMHAAVMYNRDRSFALAVLAMLSREKSLIIGDNEPYFVSDDGDYTIPVHGETRRLPHVAIEIRQDLVQADSGQTAWAKRIAAALADAEDALYGQGGAA